MSWPRFFLGGGREDRLGQAIALLETLPAGECRTRFRSADTPSSPSPTDSRGHALDRHDFGLPHEHAAAGQRGRIDAPAAGPMALDVGREQVIGLAQPLEPERADLRQHATLVGNAGGQDPVEGADAVGADQQQLVAQVVNVADLAAADRQVAQRRLQNGSRHRAPYSISSRHL